MDAGRYETDVILKKMERKVSKEYARASAEAGKKLEDYLARYEVKNKAKLEKLSNGEITKEEYTHWRTGQIAMGKRWEAMRDTLAKDFSNSNKIAASIINGYTPDVYAVNHNYGTYTIEKSLKASTSYTLYNHQAVERLIKEDPDLLPKASVKVSKDIKWNKRKITSSITQSILLGESTKDTAKRLQGVSDMNKNQAIRNARTMSTSAANVGRLDSFKRVQEMGVTIRKQWSAALDGRTRSSHRVLDGETVELDEKFSNGCMYPGDPDGSPGEVYNCRCSLVAQIGGFETDFSDLNLRNTNKLGGMSYSDWKTMHRSAKTVGKTFSNLRDKVGNDFVNMVETMLEFTDETDAKDLFYEYSNDIDVVEQSSGGAYFNPADKCIHINTGKIRSGDDIHLPYQTAFHEMGHNIDYVSGKKFGIVNNFVSAEYEGGKLQKTIKQDWETFRSNIMKTEGLKALYGEDPGSILYKFRIDLRHAAQEIENQEWVQISRDLRNGKITMEEVQQRNDFGDMISKIMEYLQKDENTLMIEVLKKEKMSLTECSNISDIIEGCTGMDFPLGVGHGAKYHSIEGSTAIEFFAEVIDSKIANPKSLEQMRRIFPNSVKVVEEIMEEMIK